MRRGDGHCRARLRHGAQKRRERISGEGVGSLFSTNVTDQGVRVTVLRPRAPLGGRYGRRRAVAPRRSVAGTTRCHTVLQTKLLPRLLVLVPAGMLGPATRGPPPTTQSCGCHMRSRALANPFRRARATSKPRSHLAGTTGGEWSLAFAHRWPREAPKRVNELPQRPPLATARRLPRPLPPPHSRTQPLASPPRLPIDSAEHHTRPCLQVSPTPQPHLRPPGHANLTRLKLPSSDRAPPASPQPRQRTTMTLSSLFYQQRDLVLGRYQHLYRQATCKKSSRSLTSHPKFLSVTTLRLLRRTRGLCSFSRPKLTSRRRTLLRCASSSAIFARCSTRAPHAPPCLSAFTTLFTSQTTPTRATCASRCKSKSLTPSTDAIL
jgi:hypothetical protein